MKMAAMHWKMAAPSMLTVAPMGRMKRLMRLSTPLFSSMHFIMDGRVAELERKKEKNSTRIQSRLLLLVDECTTEPKQTKTFCSYSSAVLNTAVLTTVFF